MKKEKQVVPEVMTCGLKFVPVSNKSLLKECGVFLSQKTLRKYHHKGIYPKIFLKIGGRIFVDLQAWGEIINEARGKRDKKIEFMNRLSEALAKGEVQR